MHYYVLAILPPGADPETALETALAPHVERFDETTEELTGHWDWWQRGGRWTGLFAPDDYDPAKDPANVETCNYCDGTGTREGDAQPGQCNGCGGAGTRAKWPTEWAPVESDVQRLGDILPLTERTRPFALLLPDGTWHESERYDESTGTFPKTPLPLERLDELDPEHLAVVVDIHR